MVEAIKVLRVRGAPAIGVAGAFGVYLGIKDFSEKESITAFYNHLDEISRKIISARPTAVNLPWAVERIKREARRSGNTIAEKKQIVFDIAKKILEEDRQMCLAIGRHGYEILKIYNTILTHCNAGGFATTEYGTALAPIYYAKDKGKNIKVFADETRPLLQGARITAFELINNNIDVTLICDNMAADVMRKKMIDAVIVGADRIALNGDTANKIGTYGLAVLAKAHNIPFYVAAPSSTFDLSIENGNFIPIEQRESEEIIFCYGKQIAPRNVKVYNPAFDVTPAELITAIITEKGIICQPLKEEIKKNLV